MLNFAVWRRFTEEYVVEGTDREELLVIANALEAAKPIVDRIGRFGLPFLTDNGCNCEMCVQDRAVQAAFAEIDFSGLTP